MKLIFWWALVFSLTGVAEQAHPFSVHLINKDGSMCTGWVAAKSTILTCGHCVDKLGDRILAVFPFGEQEILTVTRMEHEATPSSVDLAALKGAIAYPPLPLSEDDALPGQVFTQGYGDSAYAHESEGITLGTRAGGLSVLFGQISYGDSGGPVLDVWGGVVGMNKARETTLPIFYAVPARRIRAFLNEVGP